MLYPSPPRIHLLPQVTARMGPALLSPPPPPTSTKITLYINEYQLHKIIIKYSRKLEANKGKENLILQATRGAYNPNFQLVTVTREQHVFSRLHLDFH